MQPEVFATDANTGLSQEWHRGDLGYSGSVHPAQTPAVIPILPKCTQRTWPRARIDHKSLLKFICGEGKADGMDQLIPVLPSAPQCCWRRMQGHSCAASLLPPSRDFSPKTGFRQHPPGGEAAPRSLDQPNRDLFSHWSLFTLYRLKFGPVHHFSQPGTYILLPLPHHHLPAIKNFILKTERFNLKIQNGKGRVF